MEQKSAGPPVPGRAGAVVLLANVGVRGPEDEVVLDVEERVVGVAGLELRAALGRDGLHAAASKANDIVAAAAANDAAANLPAPAAIGAPRSRDPWHGTPLDHLPVRNHLRVRNS